MKVPLRRNTSGSGLAADSKFATQNRGFADRIGMLHDLRFVIFDNDTRLFFATTFDDDWDAYIDDFASLVPDLIDLIFEEVVDYPGIKTPGINDFIANSQVTGTYFYSAYPDA